MVFWLETTYFENIDNGVGTHESDFIASFYLTRKELDVDDNTTIRIVLGIKYETELDGIWDFPYCIISDNFSTCCD